MRFLLLFIPVVTALSTVAQSPSVGATVGYLYPTLSGDDAGVIEKDRFGVSAGVFADFPVASGFFRLQPEIVYTHVRTELSYESGPTYERMGSDYVHVPLALKIGVPIRDVLFPHVLGGPYVGARLNARYRIEAPDLPKAVTGTMTSPVFDWGGFLGLGLDVTAGHLAVGVDVRYFVDGKRLDQAESFDVVRRGGLGVNGRLGYRF